MLPSTCSLTAYEHFVDEYWHGQSGWYNMLALAGETGEACNVYKKLAYPEMHTHRPGTPEQLVEELGDVAYHLTKACHDAGTTLKAVMAMNMTKLMQRHNIPRTDLVHLCESKAIMDQQDLDAASKESPL